MRRPQFVQVAVVGAAICFAGHGTGAQIVPVGQERFVLAEVTDGAGQWRNRGIKSLDFSRFDAEISFYNPWLCGSSVSQDTSISDSAIWGEVGTLSSAGNAGYTRGQSLCRVVFDLPNPRAYTFDISAFVSFVSLRVWLIGDDGFVFSDAIVDYSSRHFAGDLPPGRYELGVDAASNVGGGLGFTSAYGTFAFHVVPAPATCWLFAVLVAARGRRTRPCTPLAATIRP